MLTIAISQSGASASVEVYPARSQGNDSVGTARAGFIGAVLLLAVTLAFAQQRPLGASGPQSSTGLVVGPYESDAGGFFKFYRSRSSVEALDDVDGYIVQSQRRPGLVQCHLPPQYSFVASIAEMPGRTTIVAGARGKRLMIQHTDRQVAGGAVRFADEMLNVKVRGNEGILSLSISVPTTRRALWLIVWQEPAAAYEVHFDDRLTDDNRPTLSRQEIIAMAEQISCSRKPQGK